MNFLSRFLRHYLLAVQFFTRIPVTGRLAQWVGFNTTMLRASAAHFPGVGWLLGALLALFGAALISYLPGNLFTPLVVAAWVTALGVMLTGAFHEDGLADVADGLGGSLDRERALVIMKDSRVGAFGAIAVVLALLCKVCLLALLGGVSAPLMCLALFLAQVVSRTWPLLLIRAMPHVGDLAGSKSKPLADQISLGALIAAGIWCVGALALALYAQDATELIAVDETLLALEQPLAAATLLSLAAATFMGRWFWKRLQGFTGDCLGATQQVCEIAFYLGLALAL